MDGRKKGGVGAIAVRQDTCRLCGGMAFPYLDVVPRGKSILPVAGYPHAGKVELRGDDTYGVVASVRLSIASNF